MELALRTLNKQPFNVIAKRLTFLSWSALTKTKVIVSLCGSVVIKKNHHNPV